MIRRSAQAVGLLVFLAAGKSAIADCPNEAFRTIARQIAKGVFTCSFPEIPDRSSDSGATNVCSDKAQATACVAQLEEPLTTKILECNNSTIPQSCRQIADCLSGLEVTLSAGRQTTAETNLAAILSKQLTQRNLPAPQATNLRTLIEWLNKDRPEPPPSQIERDLGAVKVVVLSLVNTLPDLVKAQQDLVKAKQDLVKAKQEIKPGLSLAFFFAVVVCSVLTSFLTLLALRLLKRSSEPQQQANKPSAGDLTVPPTGGQRILDESIIGTFRKQFEDLGGRIAQQERAQAEYLSFTGAVGALQIVAQNQTDEIQRLNQEAKKLADQVATLGRLRGGAGSGLPAPGPIAPLPASVTAGGPPAVLPLALPQVTMPEDLVLDTLSRSLEDKLVTTWKGFRKRRQVDTILSAFETERSAEVIVPPRQGEAELRLPLNTLLITNLSEAIGEHKGVQPAYLLARGPYDTWWSFSTRLSGLRDVVSAPGNQAVPVGPTSPREKSQSQAHLFRVWDGLQLLATAELSDLADRLSSFSVKSWIRTDFLRFADVLMLERDRSRGDQLNRAYALTKVALLWAGIIPIEIRLGQDRFDSSIHVAKASDTQTHLADGVILSVVRNGFLERGAAGGEKILQRPEVIVNRA